MGSFSVVKLAVHTHLLFKVALKVVHHDANDADVDGDANVSSVNSGGGGIALAAEPSSIDEFSLDAARNEISILKVKRKSRGRKGVEI